MRRANVQMVRLSLNRPYESFVLRCQLANGRAQFLQLLRLFRTFRAGRLLRGWTDDLKRWLGTGGHDPTFTLALIPFWISSSFILIACSIPPTMALFAVSSAFVIAVLM